MDKPELTVLQALAMAHGANPTAKLDGARLIRRSGEQRQEVPIELKKILASKAPDVSLQADDILFVPNSAAKSIMRRDSKRLSKRRAELLSIIEPRIC